MRRDFTINALFYNLKSRLVEDWTGQGIADLETGILRTPLPPAQTFHDDPLRILRAARFAGRFGYRVSDDIAVAASAGDIQRDLATKVSRERVGIEVKKMLERGPVCALYSFSLLCRWDLRPLVFQLPPDFEADPALSPPADVVAEGWGKSETLTKACLDSMTALASRMDAYGSPVSNVPTLLLASFLLPFSGSPSAPKSHATSRLGSTRSL